MRHLLACISIVCLTAGPASAGPNAGGTLVLHDAGLSYTNDGPNPCGLNPLSACALADTRIDGASHDVVWKIYAAFPEGSSPRLKAMTFAISYDATVVVHASGGCGASWELSDPGWPGSDTGTSIVFSETRLALLNEVYWFAGYNYYGAPSLFRSVAGGTDGGFFCDDSVPGILDEIAGYSRIGFDRDGLSVCPGAGLGACCVYGGGCIITDPDHCNGFFYGGPCDPDPCPALGACCMSDGLCIVMSAAECSAYGGEWHGPGSSCVPSPCAPAHTTTYIISDSPDPSIVGQPVAVEFHVSIPGGITPPGTVTVSDGVDSCTGTTSSGHCTLSLTTAGSRPLTARYNGYENFLPSESAPAPHAVQPAEVGM